MNVRSRLIVAMLAAAAAAVVLYASACSSPRVDLRTLAPKETIIYLETNDLAAALKPVTASRAFKDAAKTQPDLSALSGVQLAVAVTGVEAKEEKSDDDTSVAKIQPHFVAIADTHAWNFQAVKFAESKLGSFVAEIYKSEPKVERSEKAGGTYFTWTASSGRKAYALVIDSVIYFGNDESSIDKCIAVRKGDADSLKKAGTVPDAAANAIASGYISADGVAQIAGLLSLKIAADASDDPNVRSAIVGLLPQMLRGSVTDIRWTQKTSEKGIEDTFRVGLDPDAGRVLSASLATSGGTADWLKKAPGKDIGSATLYDLRDPKAAWAGVVSIMTAKLAPASQELVKAAVPLFFEAYGIKDTDLFLSSAGPLIMTETGGDDEELHAVRAQTDKAADVTRSLAGPFTEKNGILVSSDNDFAVRTGENEIVFGDPQLLASGEPNAADETRIADLIAGRPPVAARTITDQKAELAAVCDLLSECRKTQTRSLSLTETRALPDAIERTRISDLGSIGWLIAQLADE